MRYPWAVPGAKVVCVDDSRYEGTFANPMPSKGTTYTIKGVNPDYAGRGLHLIIKERPNPELGFGRDTGWRVARFRPLHTQETDMALFAHLLTPSPNSPMLPVRPIKEPMGR